MTCSRVDNDEVIVKLKNLGVDADGDKIEDIEIRLAFYEDTEKLEIAIETRADSTITAELSRAGDIVLRFDDVPGFGPEAQVKCEDCGSCDPCCICGTPLPADDIAEGECDEDCTCQCDSGECDCNEAEDCHWHCDCFPDDRCCGCDAVDMEW